MPKYFLYLFYCFLLFTGVSTKALAQYFYKDVWNAQQLIKEFATLKSEHIRNISIKSFEGNGEESEGFYCEKKIDKNYEYTETVTRSNITDQSLLTSYYNSKGLILKTIDSTATSVNRTEYVFDDKDKIKAVKAFTRSGDENNGISETHEYFYNAKGNPERMIVRKNNLEGSVINFNTDDKGSVIDEEEVKNGVKGKKYFYYYDDKDRLTDIVHYNQRAKRLLPDYIYEYNEKDEIIQMTSIEEGSSNYFIWRYTYNDKKLRETEKCFSKERKLLGKVEYVYK